MSDIGRKLLLSMQDVQKRFGSTLALRGVDLELSAGEVLALIGENGAGKSTLMKVLSGAHKPDAGHMTLAGKPYHPRGPLEARKAGVAMIYQELSIAPDLSVAENILLGVEPGHLGMIAWREMRRRAKAALAEVGRTDIGPAARAGDLSIAEQQLVEIARSVALGAKVLVLDEPTSSLTRKDIENLFTMLRRLRAQGLGIIYISHFLEEVRAVSDRFTVLRDGASVGGGVTSPAIADDQIIKLMVGRDVDDLYPRTHHLPGTVVLDVTALAGTRKPSDVTLQLRRGEVFGIAGLVGAGRTESLRAIFGLDRVKSGQVRVALYEGAAGSVIALSMVVTAMVLHAGGAHAAWYWSVLAVLGACAATTLIGALQGTLITLLQVVPFIITLGGLVAIRGFTKEIADNQEISPPAGWLYRNLMFPVQGRTFNWQLFPLGVWVTIGAAILAAGMLRYTKIGRRIYAIGSSEATARLCGIPVQRTKILVYALGGMFFGLAGVLEFSKLNLGQPTGAMMYELYIIAACVIGGTSLRGGVGTIFGTVIGALIIGLLYAGAQQAGWPKQRQEMAIGAIIIAAVALDQVRSRMRPA